MIVVTPSTVVAATRSTEPAGRRAPTHLRSDLAERVPEAPQPARTKASPTISAVRCTPQFYAVAEASTSAVRSSYLFVGSQLKERLGGERLGLLAGLCAGRAAVGCGD